MLKPLDISIHIGTTGLTHRRLGLKLFAVAAVLAIVAILLAAHVAASAAGDEAKRILALVDYIGGDYKNAVQGGKVANPDEYKEMSEFAARSIELFKQLKAVEGDKAGIEPDLEKLVAHVNNNSGDDIMPQLSQQIKNRLIKAYSITPYPRRLPALVDGQRIYDDNCAQCHGVSGKGDGPGRESMNPKMPLPANFTDPERISGLSPFKVFNTVSFGIEGTAMASFAALSEEQRWQVAFYVFTLRFADADAQTGASLLQAKNVPGELKTTALLATHSDEQIQEKLSPLAGNSADGLNMLAYLRRGLISAKSADPLEAARRSMRDAVAFYSKGNREQAYQKAVDAYLDGYELAEPTLVAKDAALGRSLETQFNNLRNAIKQGAPVEQIQQQHLELEAQLDRAFQALAADDSYTGYYAFANSALIILREGLEATLIIAAILAMLRVIGAKEATKYIHLGWMLALVAGALTWLATETVLTLSGQNRESMEGFITVFAAVALFYVGYWLHTRSEARKWRAFIEDKVKAGISGRRVFGLMGISFFAVYREAFELVLFYQALWLQNDSAHGALLWGFAAGLGALILATYAILKLGLRIPLKHFFTATGALLYILAFIFAGNGVKALQDSLWVPTTPLGAPPQIPLLGIYPTVETLAAQALMLCAFWATFLWVGRAQKKVTA